METLNDDGIIIFSSGINGTTKYSALTEKRRTPVFTNKDVEVFDVEVFSDNIIRAYPDEAKEIARFFESSFSGNLPKGINISHVGPEARANLIQTIASRIKRKEKTEN